MIIFETQWFDSCRCLCRTNIFLLHLETKFYEQGHLCSSFVSFLCVCAHVSIVSVVFRKKLPLCKREGQKAQRVDAFPIGVGDISCNPKMQIMAFSLQRGAQRAEFCASPTKWREGSAAGRRVGERVVKRGMEGRGEHYRRTAGVESREEKETAGSPTPPA